MSWTKFKKSSRKLTIFATVLSLFALAFFLGTAEQTVVATDKGAKTPTRSTEGGGTTFPGTNVGAIPDGGPLCGPQGPPRDIAFNVTGLSGTPTDIRVSMTGTHTWVGDMHAVLIAPNGTPHYIFGATSSTIAAGCGNSSDFAGPYVFFDAATSIPSGGWWEEATARGATEPLTAGNYRTTTVGGSPAGGTVTNMDAAFAGVTDPNGTWILRVTDQGAGDVGSISAASLTITAGGVGPAPQKANVDFDGDNVTDFVVVRATENPLAEGNGDAQFMPHLRFGSVRERMQYERENPRTPETPAAPPIWWYVDGSLGAPTQITQFGDAATDWIIPADFDGDGKADHAVWRPGAQATFFILNSSDSTVDSIPFGIQGDNPTVVGDYDGDGKADPAVYRCPPFGGPAGQCFYYYLGSENNPGNNITFVPWGFGNQGDFFTNNGDFDGDGKHDFCIQRTRPGEPTGGQFVLLRSSDFGFEFIDWGLNTDFIIPGDYDGDGKSDFMVRRTVGGSRIHWLLTRTGNVSATQWGIAGDVSVPGDYDGDGKQDIAIWRPDANPDNNYYWILKSSDGSFTTYGFGIQVDYPVANWYVQ